MSTYFVAVKNVPTNMCHIGYQNVLLCRFG